MSARLRGTFHGGVDLPPAPIRTAELPVRACPLPEAIRLPLSLGGEPARLTAPVGERVTAGQQVARGGAGTPDVFAPLDGRIAGITEAPVPGPRGWRPVPAVEMTDLSEPPPLPDPSPEFDWESAEPASLAERLAGGALTTFAAAPEPLTDHLARARDRRCGVVIGSAMDGQPWLAAGARLLAERGEQVAAGLEIIRRVVGADRCVLATECAAPAEAIEAAARHGLRLVRMPRRYPIAAPPILVKLLTGREVPAGGEPSEAQAAVVGAAACFAAWCRVACGLPATGRVVTVSGGAVGEPANLWAPFGATVSAVAGEGGAVVHGGPMTGLACPPDAVVTPATEALLRLDPPPLARTEACIRCGWCMERCPARLDVAALNDCFELGDLDRAKRLHAQACIACGICSYVCPSHLPLGSRVGRLKRAVLANQPPAPRPPADATRNRSE